MGLRSYLKKPTPKKLHNLRIKARKKLSILEKEGLVDLGLKEFMKKSSKVRDIDVLLKICKNKKAKKHLKEKRKKAQKKLFKFIKNFKSHIVKMPQKKFDCDLSFLNESFLGKNEKELHKIRIMVKKCRYSENLENLKPLQDALGKMHDYYNCERLLIKLKQNPKKAVKKKQKWLKKAEKIRINLTKSK